MKPVFIFGCDRSGTTLLGSLLGAHTRCVTTPESQFVYEVYAGSLAEHGAQQGGLRAAAQKITQNFRFQLWNVAIDPDQLAAQVSSYPELITALVTTYAAAVGRPSADVWVDHTPSNCSYAASLAALFPEARFIHIVRDGRAVAASLMALPWKFHSAAKVSDYWLKRVGQGLAAEAHFGPERCVRVHYEELIADPEATIRALCRFTGLEFEPQMIAGQGFAVPRYTAHAHALVGQPPDPERIRAWETRLSRRDIEIFESRSGDTLSYLGYAPKYGVRAKRATRRERYRDALLDVFFYRRFDGFRERRKRRRTLAQLRQEGYLNRR